MKVLFIVLMLLTNVCYANDNIICVSHNNVIFIGYITDTYLQTYEETASIIIERMLAIGDDINIDEVCRRYHNTANDNELYRVVMFANSETIDMRASVTSNIAFTE